MKTIPSKPFFSKYTNRNLWPLRQVNIFLIKEEWSLTGKMREFSDPKSRFASIYVANHRVGIKVLLSEIVEFVFQRNEAIHSNQDLEDDELDEQVKLKAITSDLSENTQIEATEIWTDGRKHEMAISIIEARHERRTVSYHPTQRHGQNHSRYVYIISVNRHKQGKSEGFDSCDQPSNLTQIWIQIYQPLWPSNSMDDIEKY